MGENFFRGTLTCHPGLHWRKGMRNMLCWLPLTPNNAGKRGYAAKDVDCAWLEVPEVTYMAQAMRLKSSTCLRTVAQDVRLGRIDGHRHMVSHTPDPSRGVQSLGRFTLNSLG